MLYSIQGTVSAPADHHQAPRIESSGILPRCRHMDNACSHRACPYVAELRHPKRPDWSVSSWRAARHSFSRKLRVSFRTTLDPIVVAARHRFDQIVQSQNQSQPSLTLAAQSYLQLLTKTDLSLRLKPVLACHSCQEDVHEKKSVTTSEQVWD